MGAFAYLTRVIPALSTVAIAALLAASLLLSPAGKPDRQHYGEATTSQLLLSIYTCLLHVLSMMFPARACWAIGDLTQRLRETMTAVDRPRKRRTHVVKHAHGGGSTTYPSLVFVIIIPAYKEDVETLEETLRVFASHGQARHSYHIYLGMEEKEEGAVCKANGLITTFRSSFYRMSYTVHPAGIPGEAQGKSSNESWVAKQAVRDYPTEMKKNVIVTTMDADTHLSFRYFDQIAKLHTDNPSTNSETMYIPPLVFDRNLHDVPLPVRTADIMWAGAGISSLYNTSTLCIPTSVYSLPLTLVEHVGGWDTGPGAIGEDLHMFLKCFFALSGNLHVRTIYAAASQCNVSSDLHGWHGYLDGLRARYRQAVRHMWGSLDTGYAVRQTCHMLRRHYRACLPVCKTPATMSDVAFRARDILLAGMSTVCNPDWASLISPRSTTGPKLTLSTSTSTTPTILLDTAPRPIHKQNLAIIFHRLFEAHFLPIHLALILTVSMLHSALSASTMPYELHLALEFANYCRWIGWSMMCIFFLRYQTYHRLCVQMREEERKSQRSNSCASASAASSGPSIPRNIFPTFGLIEAALFPLGGFIFGAIPATQAVLSHLFTEKLTYRVSLKPQMVARVLKEGSVGGGEQR